jgi:antitoxin ParD1/3/4
LRTVDYHASIQPADDEETNMERLDSMDLEKLRWLQDAWREGIDSGDAGEIDFAALKQEARRRLAAAVGRISEA